MALLGSIMASNAAYERVGSFLLPEHFHDPVHAMLYRRMAERIGQGRFVDALILKADLENDRMLEEAGGTAYLAQLLVLDGQHQLGRRVWDRHTGGLDAA